MVASIKDYNYFLPDKLIALKPRPKREQAKMMVFDNNSEVTKHTSFSEVPNYLKSGDLIILNDTKVIPGRLFLKKQTGGIVEILFHKNLDENTTVCIFKSSRKITVNTKLYLDKNTFFIVKNVYKNYLTLFYKGNSLFLFMNYGEVPLPKYIKRKTTKNDIDR